MDRNKDRLNIEENGLRNMNLCINSYIEINRLQDKK